MTEKPKLAIKTSFAPFKIQYYVDGRKATKEQYLKAAAKLIAKELM